MAVDVTTRTLIARPRSAVWAYAIEPLNAPHWYANIDRAELVSPGPLELGSRMRFEARFMGRTLAYTYEVVEWEPERLFTMTTQEGPFPMTTTYRFGDLGENRTEMVLRNHGSPRGFGAIAAPAMAAAMKRANRADLARIKALLEE